MDGIATAASYISMSVILYGADHSPAVWHAQPVHASHRPPGACAHATPRPNGRQTRADRVPPIDAFATARAASAVRNAVIAFSTIIRIADSTVAAAMAVAATASTKNRAARTVPRETHLARDATPQLLAVRPGSAIQLVAATPLKREFPQRVTVRSD